MARTSTPLTGRRMAAPTQRAARIRRLERELKALRALEDRHGRSDIAWALLAVAALSGLWLAVFLKLNWLSGSLPLAMVTSAALGAGLWALGRRWLLVPLLVVWGLVLVLAEDFPDWPSDPKTKRRAKLQAAIAKREEQLKRWRETIA